MESLQPYAQAMTLQEGFERYYYLERVHAEGEAGARRAYMADQIDLEELERRLEIVLSSED